MSYTLLQDGDDFEKHYWNAFIRSDLPSYEKYWATHIVSLTNRPNDIHFKKSAILLAEAHTHEQVCKAQLHYTVLKRLIRTFEILNKLKSEQQTLLHTDSLAEGLFHLTAAQDVAFEFLQRNHTPAVFDAWTANKRTSSTGVAGSKEAQEKWKKDNGYPLRQFRDYRNHLTHGRMLPQVQVQGKVFLPKVGQELNYLDWRVITDGITKRDLVNFDSLDKILETAWVATLSYFESEWQKL